MFHQNQAHSQFFITPEEIQIVIDRRNKQKSLEERVNLLTTNLENVKKVLNLFIALYEKEKLQTVQSDENEIDKIVSKDYKKEKMEQTINELEMEIERKTSIIVGNNMKWEKEREQLLKELEYYKTLSQKSMPEKPSTQTTLVSASDVSKSEYKHDTKQYKCKNCNNLTTDSKTLDSKEDGTLERMKALEEATACSIRRQSIREKYQLEYKKCVEPKVQEPIVEKNVEENANSWEGTVEKLEQNPPSAAASVAQPMKTPIDDNLRRNIRQRFVTKLLNHFCKTSNCSIFTFKNYMEHASECTNDSRCTRNICQRLHESIEHRKCCNDEVECPSCQHYISFNENKMEDMITLLERGCPLNVPHSMNYSTKEAILSIIARLAVDYGLVGDNKKIDIDNTDKAKKLTCNTSSESSPDSSSSSDEENKNSCAKKNENQWAEEMKNMSSEEDPREEWELVVPIAHSQVD